MAPPPSKKAAAAAPATPSAAAAAKAPREDKKDLVPKPDQQKFKADQDAVRAEIDALQAQLVSPPALLALSLVGEGRQAARAEHGRGRARAVG